MNWVEWEHAGIKIEGLSLAGVRTSLALPQYSLAFDVAQGLPHSLGMNNFFISHGHMDHASGIPYVISQKSMNSHTPPRFYMPESMIDPMNEIMRQWSSIEGHQYDFHFIAMKPGDEVELRQNVSVRAFQTLHRIPCQGYSLIRKYRKLKQELTDLPSQQVSQIRQRGEEITEDRREILVSFTGDTQIEFLDLSPEVRQSRILFLEVTYLDERKSVSSAREWGHTHLEELLPRLSQINSEKIVLIHSSKRYSLEQARQILDTRLPPQERERVVLFEGR